MWRMEQSIIRLVGLTRQHNSLPSFHSSPNTKRLPFMFSQLLNSFYLRILRVATFYPDVAEIWIVMYVLRSKLNQERKGGQTGVQRRRELCLKKLNTGKKTLVFLYFVYWFGDFWADEKTKICSWAENTEAYFRQNGKPFYAVTSCHEMR